MILKKILEFCIQVGKTVQVNVGDLFFLILLFFFQNSFCCFRILKYCLAFWKRPKESGGCRLPELNFSKLEEDIKLYRVDK